jgi:hypothetical protein
MSRSAKVRLATLLASIAIVAACADSPTSPIIGRNARFAAIEGDTLECGNRGWVINNGRYVCNPE